jgi:hypothetical protein
MAAAEAAQAAVRKRRAAACCAMLLACAAAPAVADYDVGAGGTTFIANGRYDLACTDLIVAGTLNLDTGPFVNCAKVIGQPGGFLNGGDGVIFLSRKFTVSPGGLFSPQTSTVAYDTACGSAPSRRRFHNWALQC